MAPKPLNPDAALEAPQCRRKLRKQVAGTLKVIMLSGGLLGGLWLLQRIAKN